MSEWISVEDGMPNDDDVVLVYHPLARGTDGEIQTTKGWAINPTIMSHWMPLPAPPSDTIS